MEPPGPQRIGRFLFVIERKGGASAGIREAKTSRGPVATARPAEVDQVTGDFGMEAGHDFVFP
jgi:hypothetical protein